MTTAAQRESVTGAIGLPVAILALLLALIPPIAFYIAWVPGSVALALGIVGLVRTRSLGRIDHLSVASTAVAGASFVLTALWFALGWIIGNVLIECLAPSCL